MVAPSVGSSSWLQLSGNVRQYVVSEQSLLYIELIFSILSVVFQQEVRRFLPCSLSDDGINEALLRL